MALQGNYVGEPNVPHRRASFGLDFKFSVESTGLITKLACAARNEVSEKLRASRRSTTKKMNFSSFWAKVAANLYFEGTTLFVICLNAIWLGVDTDYNKAGRLGEAKMLFIAMENAFCFFFSFELMIRFLSFKRKLGCIRDGWFVFDTFLVMLMVGETWILPLASGTGGLNLSILRLLRLLRLTRMVRLMRSFPSMMIVVKGLGAACKAMFFTFVLLIAIMYIFAIIFKMFLGNYAEFRGQFGTLPLAMYTLFQRGVLLDDDIVELNRLKTSKLATANVLFGVHLVYVLLSTLTLLNMLIGVCCEVAAATKERELGEARWATSSDKLTRAFTEIDEDKTNTISKKEFDIMTEKPHVLKALQDLDVEPKHLVELSDAIFEPDEAELRAKELTFDEFLELIENNKPSNVASKLDVASLRHCLKNSFGRVENIVQRLHFYLGVKPAGALDGSGSDADADSRDIYAFDLKTEAAEMRDSANEGCVILCGGSIPHGDRKTKTVRNFVAKRKYSKGIIAKMKNWQEFQNAEACKVNNSLRRLQNSSYVPREDGKLERTRPVNYSTNV